MTIKTADQLVVGDVFKRDSVWDPVRGTKWSGEFRVTKVVSSNASTKTLFVSHTHIETGVELRTEFFRDNVLELVEEISEPAQPPAEDRSEEFARASHRALLANQVLMSLIVEDRHANNDTGIYNQVELAYRYTDELLRQGHPDFKKG